MKSTFNRWLSLGLVFLATISYGKDMQQYLRDTEALVQEGKHEEALERFIWFHEHSLEHSPSMYGVRLSFALSSWHDLGAVYSPARTAMVEMRDRDEKRVMEKPRDLRLFHDVVSLNRTLGEDEKTVALFDWVDQHQPEMGKPYWDIAKNAILAAKRYDLARKYIGNPIREFAKVKAMYELNVSLYDKTEAGGEHLKAYNENNFVEESLKLIEVALALDDKDSARAIQTEALAAVDDYRLQDTLPETAVETQQPQDVTQQSQKWCGAQTKSLVMFLILFGGMNVLFLICNGPMAMVILKFFALGRKLGSPEEMEEKVKKYGFGFGGVLNDNPTMDEARKFLFWTGTLNLLGGALILGIVLLVS